MKHLPRYDRWTSYLESAAFVGLATVAVALIAASVSSALKFAQQRNDIIANLSAPFSVSSMLAISKTNHWNTNVTHAIISPCCPHALL